MNPRKKKRHPWAVVFAAISVAIICAVAFLMVTDTTLSLPNFNSKEVYAPVTFAGPVKAFTVSKSALDHVVGEPSKEAHMQAIDSVLDFAAQSGYDAVMYEPVSQGEYYCRIKGAKVPEYIEKCDSFLNKWDPMMYFCEKALARGIGVFAVYDEMDKAEEIIIAVEEEYPVSGSYIKGGALGDDATTAVYTGTQGEGVLLQPTLSADYYSLDKLPTTEGFLGLVSGSYEEAGLNLDTLNIWDSLYNVVEKPQQIGYTALSELSLTYPVNTKTAIYTKDCYLMGTSNPSEPLLINGTEITRYGQSGAFGVLVELKTGTNEFVLSQNGRELAFTLTRKAYSGGTTTNKADGTIEAKKGDMIEITSGIASALYDPSSDGNITDTLKNGAKAIVEESVRTKRSGKLTWAYKLSSGDYVMAYNTKILESAKRASFNNTSVSQKEYGELISFSGEGTPAAYTKLEGNTLKLTLLDTDIDAAFSITGSEFIGGCTVKKEENGAATLELQLTDKKLWGWDIRYTNGTTELFLKASPKKSDEKGKPLFGVRVMLDAGHGEDDTGAMGVGGQTAPTEKDVNLAVTLSTKYYLEKLGATVLLTRSDDTFKTLDERLAAQSEQTPDFFISVHHNSIELVSDANKTTGTECYYFYDQYSPFAKILSENVSAGSARQNRGEKYGYFYVTRTNVAPSVLLEVGFMVNPLEYEAVTNDEVISKTGESIAWSIYQSVINQ